MSLEINEFFVEENKKFEIKMNRNEYQALNALGDKLFSFTTRLPDEETNDEEVDTMFKIDIQMSPHQEDTYFVEFKNAIGQIIVADKVFNISPKIGDDHFFEIYNFNKNKYKDLGILDNQGSAGKGSILFLILNDFLNGVETVVNKGIRKGYKQFEDELKFIKGRVNVMSTTRNLLTGKIAIQTEYEEFSIDTLVRDFVAESLFKYDHININLRAYLTEIVAGEIELNDHDKIAWVNPNQLSSFDFAPADLPIIDSILKNGI